MSKKEISRRDFIKGAAAGIAGVATMGVLSACGDNGSKPTPEANGIYTPGTYKAKATGMAEIEVSMTFDANSITDVVLDLSGETDSIGQAAGDKLKQAILDAQSAEIDGVSGATLTSKAVMEAANKCIQQAKGEIPVELLTLPGGNTAPVAGSQAAWRTAPEAIGDDKIKETHDADVVVVGHGYAGLNACRYLASQGVKVILIESQTEDRYNAMGNEAGTPNASILKQRGLPEIDPIEYYNSWMVNTNYQANPALMMKFCQNAGKNMDEYLSVLSEDDLSKMTTAFWPASEHQMDHIGIYKFWPSTCSFYNRECGQTYIHGKNREKARHMSAGYVMFLAAALCAAAFILVNFIQLQSDLTTLTKTVADRKSELNVLKLSNDEEYNRIISSIDLEEIKRVAIGELGMGYAEEGQIVEYENQEGDYMRRVTGSGK